MCDKTTESTEKSTCKCADCRTFWISLLTAVIVVAIYHFGGKICAMFCGPCGGECAPTTKYMLVPVVESPGFGCGQMGGMPGMGMPGMGGRQCGKGGMPGMGGKGKRGPGMNAQGQGMPGPGMPGPGMNGSGMTDDEEGDSGAPAGEEPPQAPAPKAPAAPDAQ